MRRALMAVIAGGTLLAGAACDSDATTTADSAPTLTPSSTPARTLPPLPDYSADTAIICGRLQSIYQGELRDFGTAMGKMITYKEAKQTAEAEKAENSAAGELKAAAVKIRKVTGVAEDPEFKAAGVISAVKFEKSAKDRKYFDKVKTLKDMNTTVEAQLAQWLTPVAGYCRQG
ncbi:hypothetical protein ACWKSP_16185 [Micromonosporaceae bacterium Da 78-11]